MKMLFHPALPARELAHVQAKAGDVDIVNTSSRAEALSHISQVEAFYGDVTLEFLIRGTRLKWIQAPLAGLEHYIFPELAASDIVLTNMAGIYSDIIADHALTYLLMFARGFHLYRYHQMDHAWQKNVPVRHLADCTLGVLGLGGIGAEVARKGKALGMQVLGMEVRNVEPPSGVDEMFLPEQMDEILARSDFLVLCVPHTPDTAGLITRRELALMPKSAYLINICRGIVVNLQDLTAALQEGQIAGAGLDVFEVEPLPAAHPLWEMPNVIITPHCAAASPRVRARHLDVLADNIVRYQMHQPLHNVVDKTRWFLEG